LIHFYKRGCEREQLKYDVNQCQGYIYRSKDVGVTNGLVARKGTGYWLP